MILIHLLLSRKDGRCTKAGCRKETKEQKRSGGLILGFRIAYRFSPANDNWKDDKGNELSDMPSYRNNAFYITLIAAGGYFKNK